MDLSIRVSNLAFSINRRGYIIVAIEFRFCLIPQLKSKFLQTGPNANLFYSLLGK